MARIGIIANPHSKLNKQNPRLLLDLRALVESAQKSAVHQVRFIQTNSLEELNKIAQELLQEGIDVLAIMGGDGTISQTLTAFYHSALKIEGRSEPQHMPAIYLLGGGTMNMVFANLGFKKLSVAKRLANLLRSPSFVTTPLNSLKVNHQVGFLFASGTSARYLSEFYKNKTDALGSVILALKIYLSFFYDQRLYKQIVKNDNIWLSTPKFKNQNMSTCGFFCSTVERIPLGVPLFPHAKNHDQGFACLSVELTPEELPWKLPLDLILNARKPSPAKKVFSTKWLQIRGESPLDYTLDGELFPPTQDLAISLGPKLNFIS